MHEYLSPSAVRALEAAQQWANRLRSRELQPLHLIAALVEQDESRAAVTLQVHGLDRQLLMSLPGLAQRFDDTLPEPGTPAQPSEPVRRTLSGIRTRSLPRGPDNSAGTDVLLLELLSASAELCQELAAAGVNVAALMQELERDISAEAGPLSAGFEQLEIPDSSDSFDIHRVLDASANRAREGLRVLEDYARFACDDPLLTLKLKELRHDLQQALGRLGRPVLLESRDTQGDVGTVLGTETEWSRSDLEDVVAANFRRTAEALRSIEEFGKIEYRELAEAAESMRYRLYTLERATVLGQHSRARLDGIALYVLVGSDSCAGGVEWTVRQAIAGGAQMIQLRDKSLRDRELLELAQRLRRWTQEAGVLLIVNDRPDIARLARADGVHVGQDELPVQDARRVLGNRALVGVSTHSLEQARKAVLDGASYIGVGPVFASQTKAFERLAGVELLRQVQGEIRLPAFAIGGIDLERLEKVLATGISRVAVSAAIAGSADPCAAAAEFRRRLEARR